MKVFLPFLMVLGFAGTVSSCASDYTCTCTYEDGGVDSTLVIVYEDIRKVDAEDGCDAVEFSKQVSDPQASCVLE